MSLIQIYTLFFLISILFPIHAQWYIIKKDYRSNLMNYPNPGKRSLSEQKSDLHQIDCSIPYSRLQKSQQKLAWLFTCYYKRSSSANVISQEDELPIKSKKA
jgi:hypothetical protein